MCLHYEAGGLFQGLFSRYAFAFIDLSGHFVFVMAATTDEATHLTRWLMQWPLPETEIHVTGTVTDVGVDESWRMGIGPRPAFPTEEMPTDYDMGVAVPGVYDVLAARLNAAGVPERLWVKRALSITGDTVLNVDFADPEYATAGVRTSVPVINGPLQSGGVVLQARGSEVITGSFEGADVGASATAELSYLALPSALARPDDVICADGSINGVYLLKCDEQGMGPTLDFSGLFPFPPANLAGSTLSWTAYEGATQYSFHLPRQENGMYYQIMVTPGYGGAANSFHIPDLSMVDGWDTAWNFEPPVFTQITDSWAVGGNLSLDDALRISAMKGHSYPAGARVWNASPPDDTDGSTTVLRREKGGQFPNAGPVHW